jgi:hypothetical protein
MVSADTSQQIRSKKDTSQQIKLLDSNCPPLSEFLKQESEHQAWFDNLQEHHHICLWHR